MARKKKSYKLISVKLNYDIFNNLEKYCEKTKHTKTAVIELALEKYLKETEFKD